MAKKSQDLRFKQTIDAPLEEVYEGFVNATALCEWLCDVAQVDAREAGRLYLWWNTGYSTTGEYIDLELYKKVLFSWHGRGEPGITQVKVTFKPLEGGRTKLTLTHRDIGEGKVWSQARKEFRKGWLRSLPNLKSVLESGMDLRFVNQPLLGVTGLDEVTPDMAERLGLGADSGLLVQGVVDGLGAQEAGLRKGDLLLKLSGKKTQTREDLVQALRQKDAGDTVKAVFLRDGEKQSLKLKLSERPLPDIPPQEDALAEAAENMYTEIMARLDAALNGVTDEQAGASPGDGEWSVKEILAHLIATERETHSWFAGLIEGQEADFSFHVNQNTRIGATVVAFPDVESLMDELRRNQAETVAMVAGLPQEFVDRKRSYWRMGYSLLQTPEHYADHIAQIRACRDVAAEDIV